MPKMLRDEQIPPQGDARYRTHRSVKCYTAELLCGTKWCTWYFNNSIERVVYLFPGSIENVIYKNKFYALRTPNKMESIVVQHLSEGGTVCLAGATLYDLDDWKSCTPYHFIDVTTQDSYDEYNTLRDEWLKSRRD